MIGFEYFGWLCSREFSRPSLQKLAAESLFLSRTRCGNQHSATELLKVPRAHLATSQGQLGQAVPIHAGRPIIGNNVKLANYCLFRQIIAYFYLLETSPKADISH